MTRWRRAWWLGLIAGALWPAACTSTGVVGGKCRTGLVDCQGACISVSSDSHNCGGCGTACAPGVACVSGVCGGPHADGGQDADASEASDGQSDAPPDRSRNDGTTTDGGDGSPGDGSNQDGPSCKPPFDTPQQCGNCLTQCSGATPICSPADGGHACVPLCTAPLKQCGSECVDLNSDPNNCGRCGHVCPTGLCQSGTCVGAKAGHIVLVGMNFQQTGKTAEPTVLLGNAVFLSFNDPVRILAYDEFAAPAVATKVDTTIGWAAAARRRTYQITRVSSSLNVPTELSVLDYDVFLIYDQPNAAAGTLGASGNAWQQTLDAFARAGGTVIVLDGADGVDQMPQLMTNADLLPVTADTDVSGSELYNRAPTDAVGLNVLSPFLAFQRTCTLTTTAAPSTTTAFVVTNSPADAGLGAPVVVHRTRTP